MSEEAAELAFILSKDMEQLSYSINLTRLVDGVCEYTYRDDEGIIIFPSSDEAYEHVRDKKIRMRTNAVAKALAAARTAGRVQQARLDADMIEQNEEAVRLKTGERMLQTRTEGSLTGLAYANALRAEADRIEKGGE